MRKRRESTSRYTRFAARPDSGNWPHSTGRRIEPDLPAQQVQEAKYRLAEFISAHPDGIYFNDALWFGFQRYALFASSDSRLTREERQRLIDQRAETEG